MKSIVALEASLVHIQAFHLHFTLGKALTSYFREDESHTGRDIHLAETGVKEVSLTNRVERTWTQFFLPDQSPSVVTNLDFSMSSRSHPPNCFKSELRTILYSPGMLTPMR